ncbi:unnamed protein product, partial [Meganyctiphanes norvegica]
MDIIYNLHVCKDGKDQKHMGQKRTYKAVSERYAFVPREAVTKFLVLCTECPRRSSTAQLGLNTMPLTGNRSMTGSPVIRAQVCPRKEVEDSKLASPQQTVNMVHQQEQLGVSLPSPSSPPTSQPPLFTNLNSHIPSPVYHPQSLASPLATHLATPVTISFTTPPHTITTSSTASGSLTKDALVSHQGTTPTYGTSSTQHQITSLPSSSLPLYSQMPIFSFPQTLNPLTTFAPLPTHPITGSPLPTHLPHSSKPNSVTQLNPFSQSPLLTKTGLNSLPPSLTQPSILTLASALTHPPTTTQSTVTKTHNKATNSSSPPPLNHGFDEDLDVVSMSPRRINEETYNLTPPHSPSYEHTRDEHIESDRFSPKRAKNEAYNPTPPYSPVYEPVGEEEMCQIEKKVSDLSSKANFSLPFTSIYLKHIKKLQEDNNNKLNFNKNNIYPNAVTSAAAVTSLDCQGSPCPASFVGSNAEDTPSNDIKEEEDDDAEDNEDEKNDAHYNPDRLKAFNIFVRLFVDENLDRIVPINKQPKEKIQAITDACARQFPEFAERTRKRILSYLKSCRRNKRTRDSDSSDLPPRLIPAHLSSVQAEQVLASACENEAHNAKRMRLGHEPIAQPNPLTSHLQLKQVSSDKTSSMIKDEVEIETSSSPTSAKIMNGSSMSQASSQQSSQ